MPRALILALALTLTLVSSATAQARPARAEILWDTWGIPHIYAKDDAAMFRAFGWAQAQSHGDLVLKLYGESRGRAAEYWGVGEGNANVDGDRWLRTVGVPALARRWYAEQTPAMRQAVDAFAAGINDYARRHPTRIVDSVRAVLPVTGVDVVAHGIRVFQYEFLINRGAVAQGARSWQSQAGSNGWAIGPSRSASGHAMLLANPHLPWYDFWLFYEAQLTAPGMDAYGVTLVGLPMLGIAFNDRLGWTHTVNTEDAVDFYELTLDGSGYRWNGATRPFDVATDTVRVRQSDGTLRAEPLTVRRSVHGPVVGEKPGKAIALRVAGLDRPGSLGEWWAMAKARSLAEFEAALRRMQLPLFNVVYADADGHIMYLFGGLTPERSRGDWRYWSGVVPGDSAATLWTTVLPYERLPKIVDPKSGWVQNANDPPWFATIPSPLDPAAFPPYLAPRGMAPRPQRSARMLAEDSSITYDELIADAHSTHVEVADKLLPDLVAAARQSSNDTARRAAEVLARWDRATDADSRGAALFEAWYQEAARRRRPQSLWAVPWSPADPLGTPRGLADTAGAVAALAAAAARVQADGGALDAAWGDAHRLRRDSVDLPANGGPGVPLGVFRVLGYSRAPDGKLVADVGETYVAAVEFGTPVRARALLAYGNASQPGSRHRTDQLSLYARKELRPVWRTRSEVEAHLERREEIK